MWLLCFVVHLWHPERIQVYVCVIQEMIKIKLTAIYAELHIKKQSKCNTLVQSRRSSYLAYWTSRTNVVQFNGLVVFGCYMQHAHYTWSWSILTDSYPKFLVALNCIKHGSRNINISYLRKLSRLRSQFYSTALLAEQCLTNKVSISNAIQNRWPLSRDNFHK